MDNAPLPNAPNAANAANAPNAPMPNAAPPNAQNNNGAAPFQTQRVYPTPPAAPVREQLVLEVTPQTPEELADTHAFIKKFLGPH